MRSRLAFLDRGGGLPRRGREQWPRPMRQRARPGHRYAGSTTNTPLNPSAINSSAISVSTARTRNCSPALRHVSRVAILHRGKQVHARTPQDVSRLEEEDQAAHLKGTKGEPPSPGPAPLSTVGRVVRPGMTRLRQWLAGACLGGSSRPNGAAIARRGTSRERTARLVVACAVARRHAALVIGGWLYLGGEPWSMRRARRPDETRRHRERTATSADEATRVFALVASESSALAHDWPGRGRARLFALSRSRAPDC